MRTVNVANFSELFSFAEKKYGVGWNPCNELFFRCGYLTYQSYDKFELEYILECTSFYEKNISDITDEEILNADKSDKAYLIIGKFMESLGVSELMFLNN